MIDYDLCLKKALDWINVNTIKDQGIIVATNKYIAYPEVTGYFIPTLLKWEQKELALQYARWLIKIQKEDGAWYDSENKDPYVFDTAQILKGMVAISPYIDVEDNLKRACDWVLSNMQENGRLVTPSKAAWGSDDDFCSEMIHLYCLSPIIEAAKILNIPEYEKKCRHIQEYYIKTYQERILNFNMLSHFYAYVMEGLLDLGETKLVKQAMEKMKERQHSNGMIEGLNNVGWTCSTGCFQLAIVWYQLGENETADKTFNYACKLQNDSGGWYGSYATNFFQKIVIGRRHPYYFNKGEISWAIKFFLDALYYKRNTIHE